MTWQPTRIIVGLLSMTAIAACAHTAPAPSTAPAVATTSSCRRVAPACGEAPPTYARDVRPILAARCFKCHAERGVAADDHDFSRVETLRAQHVALTNEVSACAMPPSGEPDLSDDDARVLLAWAACGER